VNGEPRVCVNELLYPELKTVLLKLYSIHHLFMLVDLMIDHAQHKQAN